MTVKTNINPVKALPKKIKDLISNIFYIYEEETIHPKIFNYYFHHIFICQMGSSDILKKDLNEQFKVFILNLKQIIQTCNYIIPFEYLKFYDNFNFENIEKLLNKNLYFKFNDDSIIIYYYNEKLAIKKLAINNINNTDIDYILNQIEEINKKYKIAYLDIDKLSFYNLLDIEKAFLNHNYIVKLTTYTDDILNEPSSLYLTNNTNQNVFKNITKLKKKHKVIIFKNSFCYDTIPSAGLWKYFNTDLDDVLYFDPGIHTNVQGFKDWRYGSVYESFKNIAHLKRPSIIPYKLLYYENKHILSYDDFCSVNNLDKNKKLAIYYLCDNNSYVENITDKINEINEKKYDNLTRTKCINTQEYISNYMEKVELFKNVTRGGSLIDLWFLQNFNEIRKIFFENGYNLIIKEHRNKVRQIKHFLDYVNNFDNEFKLYGETYKDIYSTYYKKYFTDEKINIFKSVHPYIVSNKYECELLEYSDRAIVSSWTSAGNTAYLSDIKTLFLDTLDKHDIHSWSKRATILDDINCENFMNNNKSIGLGEILYGHLVNFEDFKKNSEKCIKDFIECDLEYKYRDNHPFFGNSYKTTNYDFFNELLGKINNKGIFNETIVNVLPLESFWFQKLIEKEDTIKNMEGKIYYHINKNNSHYHLYLKKENDFIFLGNIYKNEDYLYFIIQNILSNVEKSLYIK